MNAGSHNMDQVGFWKFIVPLDPLVLLVMTDPLVLTDPIVPCKESSVPVLHDHQPRRCLPPKPTDPFKEVHKLVREGNVKAFQAEKSLAESNMKVSKELHFCCVPNTLSPRNSSVFLAGRRQLYKWLCHSCSSRRRRWDRFAAVIGEVQGSMSK